MATVGVKGLTVYLHLTGVLCAEAVSFWPIAHPNILRSQKPPAANRKIINGYVLYVCLVGQHGICFENAIYSISRVVITE